MDYYKQEYCIMHTRFPNEPHRGPWSIEECSAWIIEAEEDGFKPGTFYIGIREIGPWQPLKHR